MLMKEIKKLYEAASKNIVAKMSVYIAVIVLMKKLFTMRSNMQQAKIIV